MSVITQKSKQPVAVPPSPRSYWRMTSYKGVRVTSTQIAAMEAAEKLAPNGEPVSAGTIAHECNVPINAIEAARTRLRFLGLWRWPNALVSQGKVISCKRREAEPTPEEADAMRLSIQRSWGVVSGTEERPPLVIKEKPLSESIGDYRKQWRQIMRHSKPFRLPDSQ